MLQPFLAASVNKVLDMVAWPWVHRKLSKKAVKQSWERAIADTAERVSDWLPEYSNLFRLDAGIRRYLFNTIRPHYPLVTTDELAISLALGIYCYGSIPEKKIIGQISPIFLQQWFSHLNNNSICKKYLNEQCGVNITALVTAITGCSPELLSTISAHYDLLRSYFSFYSRKNGIVVIDVHLPTPERYIDYGRAETIPVTLFSERDLDIGFFRMGCEYTCEQKWLKCAALSKNSLREVAYFNGFNHKPNDELIWVS